MSEGELSEEEGEPKLKKYISIKEVPRELLRALRKEINLITSRLRPEHQLKLYKTFEDQRDLVKTSILSRITSALDKETFPVVSGIIYKMLHQRHRHQRDEFIKGQKSPTEVDNHKRRRHKNGRRDAKRKQRAKTIDHLFELKELLRNYVDKIHNEMSKVKPTRIRSHGPGFASEDKPPINAPKWMLAKYKTKTVEEENKVDEADEVESEDEVDGSNKVDGSNEVDGIMELMKRRMKMMKEKNEIETS
ncbi:26920_t:CDS:2 [Dentiscutata erythropus]|uniref:26920_t:CDS:1 n=1 Tax=Dentiscutata erythropus TaxID=1348616 RepID=A0A9N9AYR4_9GLOM|nr:26920_t:CDS:2 [Dentiscutata erythropus]